MKSATKSSVAIIGGGVSGMTAAGILQAAGGNSISSITVFEGGRGAGGRSSTRRSDISDSDLSLSFDHGALMIERKGRTTSIPQGRAASFSFHQILDSGLEKGILTEWNPRVAKGNGRSATANNSSTSEQEPFLVGCHGMNDLVRLVEAEEPAVVLSARGGADAPTTTPALDFRAQNKVTEIVRNQTEGSYQIFGNAGRGNGRASPSLLGNFDRLIITGAAPQTQRLLRSSGIRVPKELQNVRFAPVFALMLAYRALDRKGGGSGIDDGNSSSSSSTHPAAVNDYLGWDMWCNPAGEKHGVISKVVVNSTKPNRTPSPIDTTTTTTARIAATGIPTSTEISTLVVHATQSWSRQRANLHKTEIKKPLLSALREQGIFPREFSDHFELIHTGPHRWGQARLVGAPAGKPCIPIGTKGHAFAAGDWCLGDDIQAAYESGRGAAEAVLASL